MNALDVVIPTHDRPLPMVVSAVESALATPGAALVVIVDDGSREPVPRAALPGDRRILLERTEGRGPSAARNVGIERTSAPWVAFLDDDDRMLGEGAKRVIDEAEALDATVAIGARLELREGERRAQAIPDEWRHGVLPSATELFRPIAAVSTSVSFVSRAALDTGVRFDESLWIGEDRDFLYRAATSRGGRVLVSTTPTVELGEPGRPDQLTGSRRLGRRVRDHLVLLDRYVPSVHRDGPGIDHGAGARRLTGSAVGAEHWRASSVWLVNQCAKAAVPSDVWSSLTGAMTVRGWAVPLKARARRFFVRRV